ncbi:MAG TPA: HlyD family secretion protein [Victivallales bacterium]|nr:HlyD family secretion protein [Victivallales bacterium]
MKKKISNTEKEENNIETTDDETKNSINTHMKFRKIRLTKLKLIILLVFTVVGMGIGGYCYYYFSHYVSTDDAFIGGQPVYISPQISGNVKKIFITNNEHVKAGQLLLEIDPKPFDLNLEQAKAQVEVTKSKLLSAEAEYMIAVDAQNTAAVDMHRNQILMAGTMTGSAISQEKFEHSISIYEATVSGVKMKSAAILLAKSNLKKAIVKLEQAKLNLSYTKIYAPINGNITRKKINLGSYVTQGKPILALVSDNKWINANFKETQLTHMKVGQPVNIYIDAYPGITFKGHIQSLQSGTGAEFSLLPPENATGNFVKVVQRVPVKIVFNKMPNPMKYFLALGMSVTPTVKI